MDNTATKIENAVDGMGKAIGVTIDARLRTAGYKFYSGTLSTTSATTVTIDPIADLGGYGSKVQIVNTTTSALNFTAAFITGTTSSTTYGDEITCTPSYAWNMDNFVVFQKLRLTGTTTATTYQVFVV